MMSGVFAYLFMTKLQQQVALITDGTRDNWVVDGVAFFCRVDYFTINLLFEVRHATVADLESVAVEDFMQHMTSRNSSSTIFRNICPMLVGKFLLKGGLYQRMFLQWFLLVVFEGCDKFGLNVRC